MARMSTWCCRRSRSRSQTENANKNIDVNRRSRMNSTGSVESLRSRPERSSLTTDMIKENLPADLKGYGTCIKILYRFWFANILTMDDEQSTHAALLLFVNVFKLIPAARSVLGEQSERVAKKFFGMWEWLIDRLGNPEGIASDKVIDEIRKLGEKHAKMNIKPQWFVLFLEAFHDTLHEIAKDKYTARIRFCMDQLYTVVMNIMLHQDFRSASSEKMQKVLQSFDGLQDCLDDDDAKIYLKLYMQERFCVELFLFYQDYRNFRSCVSETRRQRLGDEMMQKYIEEGSEKEINVSHSTKQAIDASLLEHAEVFQAEVFDECAKQVLHLIETGVWNGFRSSMAEMAVRTDNENSIETVQ